MAARARSRFDQDDASPRSDVYTGLLALSLIAMIVSSLLLYLDSTQYGGKAPTVTIPQPKGREGVQTGQLPPPLLHLPPPAPVGERPFTRGRDVAAHPVKPVGGEEAQAPTPPAPAADPPPAPVTEQPPAPTPPAPEPVTAPPTPAPAA